MTLCGCATLHSWAGMGAGSYAPVYNYIQELWLSGCHRHPKMSHDPEYTTLKRWQFQEKDMQIAFSVFKFIPG